MLKNYPWDKVEKGQGFFVPALDLDAVRLAGLKAAVRYRYTDMDAMYVIMQGQLGVLFFRKLPLSSPVKYEPPSRFEFLFGESEPEA